MNKNRKSTVKKNVFLVIILALLVALIGGTYARYTSNFSGEATLNVAKWNVKVNDSETLTLTFEEEHNDDVVSEKIAPATKATAGVKVDLKDTEVAVDLIVEKGDNFDANLQGLGLTSNDQIKFTVTQAPDNAEHFTLIKGTGTEADPWIIPLKGDSAFQDGDVFNVEVSLEWKDTGSNDVDDTKAGEAGRSFQLPVKITAKQHITSEAA